MRKYAAMGLTAVLVAASFPAAVLADETDVKSVRIGAPYDPVTMDYAELKVDPATYIDTVCIPVVLVLYKCHGRIRYPI